GEKPMRNAHQEVVRVLSAAYQKQVAEYSRALSLAEDLLAHRDGHVNVAETVKQIGAMVDDIAGANAGIERQRNLWLQAGHKPPPELAALLQDVAKVVLRLRDRIAEVERL